MTGLPSQEAHLEPLDRLRARPERRIMTTRPRPRPRPARRALPDDGLPRPVALPRRAAVEVPR